MHILEYVKKTLSFDNRSMALYRFLIGIIIMADVVYRLEDLTDFYTDIGLIPRGIFVNEMSLPWSFSLHLANGSTAIMAILFALHFLAGFMVCIGYKYRWAMVAAFIFTVSVHNRNWLVNNGGDDVLRAILFISIFLPLNRCFSLDSALTKEKTETKEHFSTWVLTFFFQVFAIYFVSYILKDSDIWRKDFTAVFFSSRLDIFATPFGVWLRNFPSVGTFITAFSIYLEWLGPILLFVPFLFGRFWWVTRLLLVILFVGFHVGIFLTMNIGLFTFICETMWLLFLPGPLWDKIENYFKKKDFHKLSIYYDQDCGFCQKAARILREFFLFKEVPVLSAQEHASIHSDMKKHHSWVIVNERNERFYHYDAFLELLRHSPVGRCFLFFFAWKPVAFIGGRIYHWVSHNRPLMSRFSQFLHYNEPKKEMKTLKWLLEATGAFMFVTLLMWNLTTIKKYNIKAPFFQTVTRWLHLYQEWNMFAPFPKMDNIWIEVPGVLSDGTQLDLLTGNRDIFSIRDQEFYRHVPNEHWRKYYLNMSEKHDYARYFGGFMCRKWNTRNIKLVENTTLRKMEIIVYSQMNLPNGEKGGITKKLTWRHWCYDEDYKRDNPEVK